MLRLRCNDGKHSFRFNNDNAKEILARTLQQLEALQESRRSTLDVVTPGGIIQVTPQTAEEIGGELHEMWGATDPDLFKQNTDSQ